MLGQTSHSEGSYTVLTGHDNQRLSLDCNAPKLETLKHPYRTKRSRRLSFDEPTNPLKYRLQETISPSCGLQKRFLPVAALPILLSEEAVTAELLRQKNSPRRLFGLLNKFNDEERMRQVQEICGQTTSHTSYRKVLAVLLLIDRADRIACFIESNVSDADLPLHSVPRKKDPTAIKLRRSTAPETPLACAKWNHSTAARFEEEQWTVLAPIFHKMEKDPVQHLVLRRKQPLPFSKWKPVAKRGACGQVFEAAIHPAHHNFNKAKVSQYTY